ncbi:hypothetical protein D3C73_1346750 [compost metagenome]|jgi:hypothetical protein
MGDSELRGCFQSRGIVRVGTIGGVVRVAFSHCAVDAGRVDRIEGLVVGDTRGQVRIGDERRVKGNQIAPVRYYYRSYSLGTHARSVGGFAVNRHVGSVPLAFVSVFPI